MFRHLVPLLVLALPGLAQTSSSFESDYPSLSPTSAPVASTIIANKDPSMECPVCGYGMTVGTSGGLVITSFGMYSCASLNQLGEEGKIAVGNDCWEAQALAEEKCQCKLLVDEAPTDTPTDLTSEELALDRDPAEILENEVEGDAEPYFCSICDNGMVISNYDELVMIDGQPNQTCLEYQEIADNGTLGDASCRTLQESAQEPCGCTFIPDSLLNNETETGIGENLDNNSTETASETEPPTEVSETPPVEGEGTEPPPQQSNGNEHCFDNLSDIRSLERHVVDVSVQRKYILCPDTVFDLGHVDADGNIVDGQMPIQLRPNVIYQCGEDGLRSSNCILKGGDFGVMSFYGVYDGIYETVHGAELHGLTFESQERFTAVLKAAGEVSFVECAFVSQSNMVPILLQWEGQGPSEMMTIHASRNLRLGSATTTAQSMFQLYASGSASKLQEVGASPSSVGRRLDQNGFAHVVKFIRCVFKENRATSDLAFPGLIENSYGFSELFISETLFEDNQYGESNPAPFGYAVRSYGPLTIENTCFVNNEFKNFGPVTVYGHRYTSIDNYVSQDRRTQSDCSFLAVFENEDAMMEPDGAPLCVDPTKDTCSLERYEIPSGSSENDKDDKNKNFQDSGSGEDSSANSWRRKTWWNGQHHEVLLSLVIGLLFHSLL